MFDELLDTARSYGLFVNSIVIKEINDIISNKTIVETEKVTQIESLIIKHSGLKLNEYPSDGRDLPIHLACSKGYDKIVDLLIRYDADVNKKQKIEDKEIQEAKSPLACVIFGVYNDADSSNIEARLNIVNKLLAKNAIIENGQYFRSLKYYTILTAALFYLPESFPALLSKSKQSDVSWDSIFDELFFVHKTLPFSQNRTVDDIFIEIISTIAKQNGFSNYSSVMEKCLSRIISSGYNETAIFFIENIIKFSNNSSSLSSPLHAAVKANNADLVSLLLEHNVSVANIFSSIPDPSSPSSDSYNFAKMLSILLPYFEKKAISIKNEIEHIASVFDNIKFSDEQNTESLKGIEDAFVSLFLKEMSLNNSHKNSSNNIAYIQHAQSIINNIKLGPNFNRHSEALDKIENYYLTQFCHNAFQLLSTSGSEIDSKLLDVIIKYLLSFKDENKHKEIIYLKELFMDLRYENWHPHYTISEGNRINDIKLRIRDKISLSIYNLLPEENFIAKNKSENENKPFVTKYYQQQRGGVLFPSIATTTTTSTATANTSSVTSQTNTTNTTTAATTDIATFGDTYRP